MQTAAARDALSDTKMWEQRGAKKSCVWVDWAGEEEEEEEEEEDGGGGGADPLL